MLGFSPKSIDTTGVFKIIVFVGGNGYVGRAFLKECERDTNTLFVVVSPDASVSRNNVISIRADLTKKCSETVKRILLLVGRIDVIIHGAARYAFETADFLSEENLKKEFEVNTFMPLLFTQEVLLQHWRLYSPEENRRAMRKVIVISSQAGDGKTARRELITYSATKAALSTAWLYYSDYLASLGITSTVLKPGSLQKPEDLEPFLALLRKETGI